MAINWSRAFDEISLTNRRQPSTMPKSSFLFDLVNTSLIDCVDPEFNWPFKPFELNKLLVCWWLVFIVDGGGAALLVIIFRFGTRRLTTNVTVFPLSRNTWTAVAYSTFSSDTPFTEMIRSLTLLKFRIEKSNCCFRTFSCSASWQCFDKWKKNLISKHLLQSLFSRSSFKHITDRYGWITSCKMWIITSARYSDAKTVASYTSHRHCVIFPWCSITLKREQIKKFLG